MGSDKAFIWKIISGVLFCVIIANLVYLNVITYQTSTSQLTTIAVTPTLGPSQLLLTPTPDPSPTMITTTVTAAPAKTSSTTSVTNPGVKEYFIPFGTGSSSANDWTDVPGMQATIDTTSYPNIKKAVFEVTVHVPNTDQQVSVRLYNVTDKHPVWFSDVVANTTPTATFLTSQPVTLGNGSKVYQVQLKTQLQSSATIDQARLHITLQ